MDEKEFLAGITVLVARPIGQGERLCTLIRAAGGKALHIPAIEIHPLTVGADLHRIAQAITSYYAIVFVSANAVEWGMRWLENERVTLPQHLVIGAVGRQTAQALRSRGITVTAMPHGRFDSEGLLALPALQQVDGMNILIIRGRGGRELLADELCRRGASVEYAQVYERRCPAGSLREKIPAKTRVDIVVATSNEIMDNLLTLAGSQDRTWLCSLPLIVLSERNAQHAGVCGFVQQAHIAASATDEAIVDCLRDWVVAKSG